MAFKSIDITLTDTGIDLLTSVEFQNPTHVTMKNLEQVTLGVQLENYKVADVTIRNLELKESLQTMKLSASFNINTSNPLEMFNAVSKSLEKVLVHENLDVDLRAVGPISMTQVGVVQNFTDAFSLKLPVKEILSQFPLSRFKSLVGFVVGGGNGNGNGTDDDDDDDDAEKNMEEEEGILLGLLGNTTLDVQVGEEGVDSKVSVRLPRLFPLPETVEFNYNSSVSLFAPADILSGGANSVRVGGNSRLMKVDLGRVVVKSYKREMVVETEVKILPENTENAARELGVVVNRVLAAEPKVSEEVFFFFFFFFELNK
jgi:hypothetical protein